MNNIRKTQLLFSFVGIISLAFISHVSASFPYYGTKIGALKRLHHGVSGDVYAVDSRTLFIKNFNYDGEAPAAYFYVGNTNKPSNEGAYRLRDERGGTTSLTRRYRNKDITLSLPEGKTLRDIKWFSVWCDEFAVNFGDVSIPSNLDFPRPQKISALKGVHGVSADNIVIVDAQTLLVPNFSYDGEAPDAKFWVGRGQRPTAQGLRIPDENGKETALRRYDRKTIVLTLPGDLTIFDIGHFGVWCEAFTVDFGHVRIPEGLNVPPSLKMLGISPQSKLNCEVLYDDLAFEVRWAVAGESIVVQLVAKLGNNDYMSFGISPNKDRSQMIGSDVVVAWVDKETGKGFAQDYFLDDKSQCSGGRGTCPDINIEENTNSIRLLNAAMVNGYSIVTYQRSLQATDKLDLPIAVNGSEAIVWAIGPLNERKEASFHTHYPKRTHLIDFGRQPTWNCPMPEGSKSSTDDDGADDTNDSDNVTERDTASLGYPPAKRQDTNGELDAEEEFYENRAQALQRPNRRPDSRNEVASRTQQVPTPKPVATSDAWDIPAIQCYEPEDGVFYAQMGPTGGKHGYPAITGHVGWGISWYINGLLIPEIHVVRGKTYTFVVEGGNNPDIPAKYHPFYITDDPVGGYEHKREEEKKAIRIFAGVHRSRNGQITPTGVGRLCNWTPDVDGPPADDYQSFGAYQRTLTLKCDPGEPGVITWKPDRNTPDTVYYHCFTHRYLGWKIHVHDSCDDARFAASEKHEVRISPEDITAESSIRHETKVSPNDNFLLKHQTDLIKNHNMNGTPPKLTFEITKSTEITKLISDGIRAAEALEESILRTNPNSNSNTQNNSNNNNIVIKNGIQSNNHNPTGQYKSPLQIPPVVNKLPHGPYMPSAVPDILKGETHIHFYQHQQTQPKANQHNIHTKKTHGITNSSPSTLHYIHQQNHQHQLQQHILSSSNKNLTNHLPLSQKTISLSEYLHPPQNAPLFHPVKLPGRRPIPGPIKKVPPSKTVLPQQLPRHPPVATAIPQPSLIVNHYRKPVPGLLKPFLREKPFPLQPIAASVLLLGQPTELGGNHRKNEPHVLHHPKVKTQISVPYSDLVPQDTISSNIYSFNGNIKKEKKPSGIPHKIQNHAPERVIINSVPPVSVTPAVFKRPFDVHPVKEETATMKPAVNDGFKPDSVVVESGFRPIIRHDSIAPADVIDQVANRREDPGSEIDEVMETDTLFLTAQKETQTQNFEPMFIPSPPDSTNSTIIVRKVVPSPPAPLTNPSILATMEAVKNLPAAAKLRDPTLEDLLVELISSEKEKTNQLPKEVEKDSLLTDKKEKINEKSETPEKIAIDELMDDIDLDEDFEFENDDQFEDDMETDREAQAAERIDTYYLPPPGNRKIPQTSLPSGPVSVVAYNGKSIVDSSLVLPPKLDSNESNDSNDSRRSNSQLSKIEQLVRSTPQFRLFRGEVPPSISEYLSTERSTSNTDYTNSHLQSQGVTTSATQASSILSSKSSSTFPRSPLRPISTKLHILKNTA